MPELAKNSKIELHGSHNGFVLGEGECYLEMRPKLGAGVFKVDCYIEKSKLVDMYTGTMVFYF